MNRHNERKSALKTSAIALLYVGPLMVISLSAFAYSGEAMAKDAKVTLAEATAIVLKAHPGVIADKELEKEAGGSGLRYSFDIKNGTKTYEVGVDAETGKLLENALEGKNPD
ncbi:MAG: PepSY domain-containing protein [Parvibaculaceae bacterium]